MPEQSLTVEFLDYSNDPDRDRVAGRALIKTALTEWQGDSETSVQHAVGSAANISQQDPVAVDALIRIRAFERQFAALLPKAGVCSQQHSGNRMLALAAAIAHADLRLCAPGEFSLAPSVITEALVSLHLDNEARDRDANSELSKASIKESKAKSDAKTQSCGH
jgi:hypothetical protein